MTSNTDGAEMAYHIEPVEPIEELKFVVLGVPVPQGSKVAFIVGKGQKQQRAVIVDSNKDSLRPWRAAVQHAGEIALAGRQGITDAACVHLEFHMPRPKTVTRMRPSTKPDIDKLSRALLDGLTDSGVLQDDALVVSLHVEEWYADDEPYAAVKVTKCL